MTQISFYHLTKTSVDEALPKLLEKALESGERALLNLTNEESQKHFDDSLWAVGGTRFIPHGINGKGDEELQPVLISNNLENKNKSKFLFMIGANDNEDFSNFSRVIYIFNGNDDQELSFARDKWKKLKEVEKFALKYYFQNEKGNWQEKA